MSIRSFLLLATVFLALHTSFGADAPQAGDCQYNNDNFLTSPDEGVPTQLFHLSAVEQPSKEAWQYQQILICERSNGRGGYILVRDANRATNPPQEILEDSNADGWRHLVINTSGKNFGADYSPAASLKDRDFELVGYNATNGNPARFWVFTRNPNVLGNLPIQQAQLEQVWSRN